MSSGTYRLCIPGARSLYALSRPPLRTAALQWRPLERLRCVEEEESDVIKSDADEHADLYAPPGGLLVNLLFRAAAGED